MSAADVRTVGAGPQDFGARIRTVLWAIERVVALLTRADLWRRQGEAVAAIQLANAAGELLWELGQGFELEPWFVDELEEVRGAVEMTDGWCLTRETQALSRAVCRWIEARRSRRRSLSIPIPGGLAMEGAVYLRVPFEARHEARKRGARWDGERRSWYVPKGLDSGPFARWLPDEEELPFRQVLESPYFVIEATTVCWKCGETTPVIAIAGHLPDEETEPGAPRLVVLSQVHRLPAEIAAQIEPLYPRYGPDRSATANRSYLMNHCACRAKLGDFYLHQEPGGAFYPRSVEEAGRVGFRELPVAGSFEFKADYLGGWDVP